MVSTKYQNSIIVNVTARLTPNDFKLTLGIGLMQ